MLCLKIFLTFVAFIITAVHSKNATDVATTVIYEEDLPKSDEFKQLSPKIEEINTLADARFSKELNEFRNLITDLRTETIYLLEEQRKETKLLLENCSLKQDFQRHPINQQITNLQNEVHKVDSKLQMLYNNTRSYPTTCAEALNDGGTRGVYKLQIPHVNTKPFSVYCEEDPDGGPAWTIFQRRQDGTVDFYRNWTEYKTGFGNLNGEYFMGLELLHLMTNATKNELWIKLGDFENVTKYAKYSSFGIGNEQEAYILNKLGTYNGDAGDSFSYHIGSKFSTKDVDNDISSAHCAVVFKGAWWFAESYNSHLNGRYLIGKYPVGKDHIAQGVAWYSFRGYEYSLKYTHMAIRPAQ